MAFNPGVQDRSGEFLLRGAQGMGAGIRDAGNNIAQMLARQRERKEKQEEEDKQRNRAFKGLVAYADATGLVPKDRAETMSYEQLDGTVKGAVFKEGVEKVRNQEARVANAFRQMGILAGEDPGMGPLTEGDQAAVNSRRFNLLTGKPEVSEAAIARVLLGNQVGDPAAIGRMLVPEEQVGKARPIKLNVDGTEVIFSPDTGRYDFLPQAPAAKAPPALTPGARLSNRVQIQKQISALNKEFETASPVRQRMIRNEIAGWEKELTGMDGEQPTAPAAVPKMDEKVEVIAPNGKRGMIPKSQLQQALKQGYKQTP